MRIGVDATCWANQRGYGRFAREIVTAMAALAPHDEFYCFLDSASRDRFALDSPNVRAVLVSGLTQVPARAASAAGHRTLADMLRMTRAVKKERLDAFFSPSVYTYYPLPIGLPAVVTIHDAIPERFPRLVFPSRKARFLWSLKMRLALFQARRILTVSEYAARDLARVLRIPGGRISVALEAPSADYERRAEKSSETNELPTGSRWFVYVGGFSPHKNVIAAVNAHAALARELGDAAPYLLLVGTRDKDDFYTDVPAIERAIEREGTSNRVRWTGFVGDEELSRIHSGSIALILPSESEGFGLPAVEAAACGSPVIATTESPLPEILEGGGIFIPPGDEAALLSAMRRLATDTAFHESCSEIARERAGQLSWASGATAALAAIREAAAA